MKLLLLVVRVKGQEDLTGRWSQNGYSLPADQWLLFRIKVHNEEEGKGRDELFTHILVA